MIEFYIISIGFLLLGIHIMKREREKQWQEFKTWRSYKGIHE